jgi:hypothetical protein
VVRFIDILTAFQNGWAWHVFGFAVLDGAIFFIRFIKTTLLLPELLLYPEPVLAFVRFRVREWVQIVVVNDLRFILSEALTTFEHTNSSQDYRLDATGHSCIWKILHHNKFSKASRAKAASCTVYA